MSSWRCALDIHNWTNWIETAKYKRGFVTKVDAPIPDGWTPATHTVIEQKRQCKRCDKIEIREAEA